MTAALRTRPKLTEAQLHRQVATYLDAALSREDCVWTTFPAGGGGKVRGAKLKAAGLRAGWPDIQIVWALGFTRNSGSGFVGIELKAVAGALSPEQRECHKAIEKAGGYVYVCRSVDQVHEALCRHTMRLRATLMPGGGWSKAA